MNIYAVVFIYAPMFLLVFSSNKEILYSKFLIVAFCFFYVFYNIDSGPDHSVYMWVYDENPDDVWYEPLYMLLSFVSRLLGFDYSEFLILNRLISLSLFLVAILRLSKTNVLLFMGMYLPFAFVTFELNLLRQSLALHFAILSVSYLIDGHRYKSYTLAALASLTHVSSLLSLSIYSAKFSRKTVLLLVLVVFVLVFGISYFMHKFLQYQELGALRFRLDIAVLQIICLLLMPLIFFKIKWASFYYFIYALVCLSSFVPVMIRLYPLGLLFLLPIATGFRTKNKIICSCFFLCTSLVICAAKTHFLLKTDELSIQQGVYSRGYLEE